jgi:hypothetical protein
MENGGSFFIFTFQNLFQPKKGQIQIISIYIFVQIFWDIMGC